MDNMTTAEYARSLQQKINQYTIKKNTGNFELRNSIKSLKDLKVAAVMDEFTYYCFEPECNLLNLDHDNWKEELEQFQPDLLFVESAWLGRDNKWKGRVYEGSKNIAKVINFCRARDIPVIFWNKEDPVHAKTWRDTLRMADFVFTTDIDMIPVYKRILPHDNIYHLHFAAQPKLHNPVEKFNRKPGACFAGSYYARYKHRSEVFCNFADHFMRHQGIDIYDRNLNQPEKGLFFPDRYKKVIAGTLSPQEIDIAYKGYHYGIDINTITNSATMFARRAFELMACNTIVVGNYSKGIVNYFGDLTISTDDINQAEKLMSDMENDVKIEEGIRLQALNTVLRDHLYEDRLNTIVKIVFKKDFGKNLPRIHVIRTKEQDPEKTTRIFDRQIYDNKILSDSDLIKEIPDDDFVCILNENSFYGEEYLENLALSLRYSSFDGYAKPDKKENSYRGTSKLRLDAGIVKAKLLKEFLPEDIHPDTELTGAFFNTDSYNYAPDMKENYPYQVKNTGKAKEYINGCFDEKVENETEELAPAEIYNTLKDQAEEECLSVSVNDAKQISVNFDHPKQIKYVRLTEKIPAERCSNVNTIKTEVNASGSGFELFIIFYSNENDHYTVPFFIKANEPVISYAPSDFDSFFIGARLESVGEVTVKSIKYFKRIETPVVSTD